jgi:hypothetical protein
MGSPVWSHNGLVSVANAHRDKVKLTFSQGVSLPDPHKLFNAGLGGNKWRAIDFHKDDEIIEADTCTIASDTVFRKSILIFASSHTAQNNRTYIEYIFVILVVNYSRC